MIKRLLLLNGLAIFSVVCSHAIGWGFTAMFLWADRYRPVTVPNYDQVGTFPYYCMLVVLCLDSYAVPAFLFVSGFFVTYAARGTQSTPTLTVIKTRLKYLLIPYFIWSVVIFVGDAVEGIIYAPHEYLMRLFIGGAHPVYFFVPLLCQFYLLSPLVIRLARTNWKLLLLISAFLQLATLSLRYLDLFVVDMPIVRPMTDLLFPLYGFFFAFGVVSSLHLQPLKVWLAKFKWSLFVALIGLGLLTVVESEVVFQLTGIRRGGGPGTVSTSFYAIVVILCFLAFYRVSIPLSKEIYWLGSASFGIYLLHPKVLEFAARGMQKFVPWILAYQVLFQSILIVSALGGSLLFMTVVARSPARKAYRHLFG